MKKIILILLGLVYIQSISSQVLTQFFDNNIPSRLRLNKESNNIPVKLISPPDVKALLEKDKIYEGMNEVPYCFGKAIKIHYTLDEGSWYPVDGGNICQLNFESKGAYNIGFIFSELQLAEKVELYIVSKDRKNVYGPVTSQQNTIQELFVTDYVKGDYATILLYEPWGSKKSNLTISNVIYVYKNINETNTFNEIYTPTGVLPCQLDISQYPDWERESNAIAQIEMLTTDYMMKVCSGALIMNQNQDFKPYLLTAFHCLDFNHDDKLSENEKNTLKSWKFNFKYKKNTHDIKIAFNGASFRSGWVNTDFVLLELKAKIEAAYQLSWLGWDRSGKSSSSGTSLHHPRGYDMKISFEQNDINKYDKERSWYGTSSSPKNTHWFVDFDEGITEGGSSGGPLLNQNRRVIGQLHGGGNAKEGPTCDDRTAYYGCFDVSWEGGGSKETRLKDWLSPASNMVMNTSEMNYSIIQTDENGVYVLKNYSPGVSVDWQVSSPDFYLERLLTSTVKIQPEKYGLSGTLSAKVYFQGRLVGDESRIIFSSPLAIQGDTYLSAREKRYTVNFIPYGGRLTWSVAPGMVIKEKGTDYIVVTADKATNPWLKATVIASGTTTVKELKLHNEQLAGATMECLKTWRGTYDG